MKRSIANKITAVLLAGAMAFGLGGCVNQHPDDAAESQSPNSEQRIVATSNATLWIMDALEIDLVGRCTTSGDIPERYKDLPEVGTAMSPDAEKIASLNPTDVIGPDTLEENIKPTYDSVGVPYTFIQLQSVQQMYDSIKLLGDKYDRKEQAQKLIDEYDKTMADFQKSIEGKEHPKVLMLMGLPGAYIECTANSYAGSLLDLAGATNVVVTDDGHNFKSWSTEELLKLDPDYILLTAHGLPDEAMEYFAKEFSTNDIWQHFRAVQEGHVYKLDYKIFGMSATFDWPEALKTLQNILYEGGGETFDTSGANAAS